MFLLAADGSQMRKVFHLLSDLGVEDEVDSLHNKMPLEPPETSKSLRVTHGLFDSFV